MRKVILFICLIPLLSATCTKEAPEPDPGDVPSEDLLVRADIGPEGGKLQTEDFLLVIPEGAFDTTVTISLFLEDNDPSRLVNQITPSYRLTGLKQVWNKSLELSIRYDGDLEEGNQIAFGFTFYEEEFEDSVHIHELYEATDSLGFLKCILSPVADPDPFLKTAPLSTPLYHPLVFHNYLMVRGMTKIGTHRSDYAEIKYDKGVDLSKVIRLGQELDEAILFFHAQGFINANLFTGKYKLRVQILDENNNAQRPSFCLPEFEDLKGLYVKGKNYFSAGVLSLYTIKFPLSYFRNVENNELRGYAGRGVFHYGSYCRIPEEMNWIYFAFRTWVEEYFHGSSLLSLEESRIKHPFYGLNVLEMNAYSDLFEAEYHLKRQIIHGMRMTPLISYLMDNYNSDLDLITKIYDQMQNAAIFKQPVDAILNSISVPEYQWWPAFIRAYLEGSIRDIPAEMFLGLIDAGDQMHFMDKTDTLKYFDRSYPDFSAKLCQLNLSEYLSESVLGERDKMTFELGPDHLDLDYVKVQVYAYKEGELEFLSEGSEVTIPNLKGLIEDGNTKLLAVVINSLSEAPYLDETGIELSVRIIREKEWPWTFLAAQVVVTEALFRSADGTEYTWAEYQYKISDQEVEVSEDGTRFTASWLDQDADYKYEGGIEISMDKESFAITSFYLWSNSESLSEGKVTLSEKTRIHGKEGTLIPMVYWDDVFCYHQAEGSELCPVIASYTYENLMYPGETFEQKNTLVSYTCLEEAELIFYWAKRPLGILGLK